jgi:outer membrane biosynthesis protein TonB
VRSVDILKSPDARLSKAALAAVKQWKNRPYVVDGHPVQVESTAIMTFDPGPRVTKGSQGCG